MKLILLAQAQLRPGEAPSLTDLRWLRFPTATSGQYLWFGVVLLAIVLTVAVTLVLQGLWQGWRESGRRHKRRRGVMTLERLAPDLQALARQLAQAAPHTDAALLVVDPQAFETAVELAMSSASGVDAAQITRLRRELQMTVMNPHAEIVSTRQLLTDLPVRLTATVGEERLELYCSLLEVNERALLIDVPYDREVYALLGAHPEVVLAYWQEGQEHPAFKLQLQPFQAGRLSIFRSRHAMRTREVGQRTDFRLALDLPVIYHFLSREQLAAYHESHHELPTLHGQGRLVDLSESGAALVTAQSLTPQGLAQLYFDLKGVPVRAMWEVLHVSEDHGGHLVHGRFRSLPQEQRSVLHAFLIKEQFQRVKMRETIHISTGEAQHQGSSGPVAHGAASPAPHGAARPAPHGAPGPVAHGAASATPPPAHAAPRAQGAGNAEPASSAPAGHAPAAHPSGETEPPGPAGAHSTAPGAAPHAATGGTQGPAPGAPKPRS